MSTAINRDRRLAHLIPGFRSPEFAPDVDIDGHCDHVVIPDASRTAEVVTAITRDDEAMGRLYQCANTPLDQRSDAWKARRFEEFMADYKDAARHVAKDEIT